MDNNFFENVFNHLGEASFVMDRTGTIVYVNDYLLQHSLFSKGELLSSSNDTLFRDSKTDINIFQMVREQKQAVTAIQTFSSITGSTQTCLVTQVPIFDEYGEVAWSVGVICPIDLFLSNLQRARQSEHHAVLTELYARQHSPGHGERPVYRSKSMEALFAVADMFAASDASILIQGESGTGKEVVARYIHDASPRRGKRMVAVNCAAINENLMESELFGYEKGAFTGASGTGKKGLIEQADGSTLFLDEVNSLPLSLQAKLLRVLETHEVRPLGSQREIRVNFRVIAATNANLEQQVAGRAFREDLYYRLNVLPLTIPPLRERREDIPALAEHFLAAFGVKYARSKVLSPLAMDKLCAYAWPGNVRELRNFLERLMLMTDMTVQEIKDIPDVLFAAHRMQIPSPVPEVPFQPQRKDAPAQEVAFQPGLPLKEQVAQLEQELIRQAVERYGSLEKTARALGMSKSTLIRKREANRFQ